MSTKITTAKGFVTAQTVLPKGVTTLGNAEDGIYFVIQNCPPPKPNYDRLKTLPQGTIIWVSAGGHMYELVKSSGNLRGLGKSSRRNNYPLALVQRVAISSIEFGAYVAPRKVTKKKVTKKKVAKKRVTRKRRY
ncbi:MAG: hypothetical protein ACYSW3_25315 [Planctomycetota bacterium]|jgi:hypothetical protein